uniref:Chitin-binding type-2 domain-containing protein n=1 Tax=Heliothis virescens TaxID=7102 RepID=A0A2A4J250_HELVI
MWSLVIFLCLTITWAAAQNGRGPQHQDHNGHGWDIRLAVPGEPGSDYPTLGAIPRTSFSCAGRDPGYYADIETNCQVFRVCTVGSTYGFQSFLCPNGTLFNQAVFVCDWWMNVDCQNSQQYINNNNEQFENLRLGPQLMKDIKKMLTHPMRNPYDKSAMKSNLIVMQEYKPPFGQLFPNGALLAGPERAPNNVYFPAKQIQQNLIQGNPNDYTFSASTPDPRYIPAPINTNFLPLQRDAEVFQRQRQNGQYNAVNSNGIQNARVQTTQVSQTGNLISNGHAGRFSQNGNSNVVNTNTNSQVQAPRPTQISNNFSQRQTSSVSNSQLGNAQNTPRVPNTKQRAQYSEPRRLPQTNNEATLSRTQNYVNNNNQDKQPYTYSTPSSNIQQYPNNLNNPAGRELKQNLVSTIKEIPSTVITKTVSYSRVVQEPKVSKPKSRITVKTWIVKPTKSARLIAEPTPYTYARPSSVSPSAPSPTERLIEENTPYVYERPTTSSQTEKIISPEPESGSDSEEPYSYPRPTPAAKQIETTEIETTRIYIAPTTIPTRPTYSGRLNSPQTSPLPTKASRLYLTPSPFTSTARFYLPPPRSPTTLPRLYLPSNDAPQPVYYQSSQLRASPTMPSTTRATFNENFNQPSYSVPQQSQINANQENLTFADILTKEKLDITVNDIVKDTDNILKTASPPQYVQYKEFKSIDYSDNNNFITRTTTDSGESLTSQVPIQTPTVSSKSSRIIATPATSLQPPNENFIYQNSNKLSNLPFFKETGIPNTIERTVSIKITIPERIAAYLFKNRSDPTYDKLEILNTGSSNYLVMSDNFLNNRNAFNFIPIAKLIGGQNSNNISDSQALVYSFLTDSINVAREYNNIAQQEILTSTATPATAQFQNLNNDKLSQITNQISSLTSSQYNSNDPNSFVNSANIPKQKANINLPNQFTGNARYTDERNQGQQIQTNQLTPSQQTQGEFYSSQYQIPNTQQNALNSQNQLYSGQLYQWSVPDVTNQIYNRPSPANFINPSNIQQQAQMFTLQRNTNQNNAGDNFKQSNPQFEVVKANAVDLNPAKLQLETPNESEQFTSQEALNNLINSQNGISAHLEDKIVGTIQHPSEENKLLTYKKDQSYYLYTKLEENTIDQNSPTNQQTNTNTQQNAKLIQTNSNNMPNVVSFQLIPSVSYELEDEKDKQQILSAFQIDEFGAPRDITRPQNEANKNQGQQIMTSRIDFAVEHPTTPKQNEQFRINPLYSGPSSYTAPQSSVGSLGSRQIVQNNFNSRLEDFDSNNSNGYPRDRPARQFFS